MSKKVKTILLSAVSIVLFISAVYFIFFIQKSENFIAPSSEKQTTAEKQMPSAPDYKTLPAQNLENKFKQTFIQPFIEYFTETNVDESFFEKNDNSYADGQTEPQKEMSDEEYFRLFYPDYYIEYLMAMEKMMVDDKYVAETEKQEFASEKDIIAFLNIYIDYLANKNVITEGQKLNFKFSVNNTLPELNQQEKKAKTLQMSKIKEIIAELAKIAPKTKKCHAIVDCFWPGVPKHGGVNLWAPCCNCGWNCGHHGCWYVPDCGVGGCMINQGCRNGVCGYANASIWDPMSGICGCG